MTVSHISCPRRDGFNWGNVEGISIDTETMVLCAIEFNADDGRTVVGV